MPWKDAEKRRQWKNNKYRNDPTFRSKENLKVIEWKRKHPEYHKEYYLRNKEHMVNNAQKYHKQLINELKQKLIMVVQGYVKCNLCPIDDIILLEFHHIKANGNEDRKRFENRKHEFNKIPWLKHMIKHYHREQDTYPLQVLCSHCHKKITYELGHNNKKEQEENLITLTNFI